MYYEYLKYPMHKHSKELLNFFPFFHLLNMFDFIFVFATGKESQQCCPQKMMPPLIALCFCKKYLPLPLRGGETPSKVKGIY